MNDNGNGKKEYQVHVIINGEHYIMKTNLELLTDPKMISKTKYRLAEIDEIFHDFPNKDILRAAIVKRNNIKVAIDKKNIHIFLQRRPKEQELPIIYSDTPLPLEIEDIRGHLTHAKEKCGESKVAWKNRQRETNFKMNRKNEADFIETDYMIAQFLTDIKESYRLRRAITLSLVTHGEIAKITPKQPFLEPSKSGEIPLFNDNGEVNEDIFTSPAKILIRK